MTDSVAFLKSIAGYELGKSAKYYGFEIETNVALYGSQDGSPKIVGPENFPAQAWPIPTSFSVTFMALIWTRSLALTLSW